MPDERGYCGVNFTSKADTKKGAAEATPSFEKLWSRLTGR
jgi:hypothetical protein